MINWNKLNIAKLTDLWNKGYEDKQILQEFNYATGKWAIAKQRSILGLVKNKRKSGTRAPKTIVTQEDKMFYAGFYEIDGKHHFIKLNTENPEKAKAAIKVLMQRRGITKVILMEPITKLIGQKDDDFPFC